MKRKLTLVALLLVSAIVFTGCGKKNTNEKSNSNVESNKNEDTTVTSAERTTITNKFYNLIGAKKDKEIIKGYIIEQGDFDYSRYLFGGEPDEFYSNSMAAILHTTALTEVKVDKTKLNNNIAGGVKYVDEKTGTVSAVKIDFLNKQYKNVFGKDLEEGYYKGNTVNEDYYDCEIAYQRNLNMFVAAQGGCGGVGFTSNVFYLEDVVKEDGNLVVKTYVGTHVADGSNDIYYKDAAVPGQLPYTKDDVVEAMSEKTKTQYTLYKFVFKKASDGNYYYDSVKKA